MRLRGKVAIITGGGSGFGRETALRFAQEGAVVTIGDLDETGARETARQVAEAGGRAEVMIGDVSSPEVAEALVIRCVSNFGGVDVLVNNAGISGVIGDGESWNSNLELWDRVIRVNLRSVFLCTRAAVPRMLERGAGAIVNLTSIATRVPAGGAPYAASKGGILSYTQVVARELASRKIRVNCVAPGLMRTPMTTGERQGLSPQSQQQRLEDWGRRVPMGVTGEALDVANAILFLASDEAAYVTGHELVVDGGYLMR